MKEKNLVLFILAYENIKPKTCKWMNKCAYLVGRFDSNWQKKCNEYALFAMVCFKWTPPSPHSIRIMDLERLLSYFLLMCWKSSYWLKLPNYSYEDLNILKYKKVLRDLVWVSIYSVLFCSFEKRSEINCSLIWFNVFKYFSEWPEF